MAKTELMLPKGMRDRDPADKILEQSILDTIREVYELYGYAPLETPMVERMDILTAKFAAGDGTDVMNEIFSVQDQGDRELGLRFDHTVPLCRYVAMNPMIKMPFKRYALGRVFRDGPIKLGRYREFWQADADIIGVPGVMGDCEGVMMAAEVFQKLNLDVVIKVGSRTILNAMMEKAGIDDDMKAQALISLDKLAKIGAEGVSAEMLVSGIPKDQVTALLKLAGVEGTNGEKLSFLKKELGEFDGLAEMAEILDILSSLDVVSFDPTLARGLQYYTGFIYECFKKNSKIRSSLIGSGRFDKMVGQFLDGKQDFPGVGLSFGVSVIADALREDNAEMRPSTTEVYVIPVSDNERRYAFEIAQQLRANGIKTDMDLVGKSIGKNFSYADTLGIPVTVTLGENEASAQTCSLKNLQTGNKSEVSKAELCEAVRGLLG